LPAGEVTDWKRLEPPPGIVAIIECKTAGVASHGSVHEWGTDENPTVPIGYELQTRHYELVLGCELGFVVALLGGRGLAIREVRFDQDYADWISDIEERFWLENVVAGVPPDPDGSQSAEDTVQALHPVASLDAFEGGSDLDILWKDFKVAKEAAEDAEKWRKELRSKIIMLIGDAPEATVFGKPVLTFRNSKDGEKFNESKFKYENPKLWAQYCETKPGHRSLREAPK